MTFCHNCGANLTRDEIIERDGFSIDPRGLVSFASREIALSPSRATIIHTIATADGRPVPIMALSERIGTDADDPEGLIRGHLSAMRRQFERLHAPFPIKNVFGRGYRWELSA